MRWSLHLLQALVWNKFNVRFIPIFAILVAIYNPTPYCYTRWLATSALPIAFDQAHIAMLLVGLAALGLVYLLLHTADKVLGHLGIGFLALLLFVGVVLISMVFDIGWTRPRLTWAAEIAGTFILTMGLLWPALYRRIASIWTTSQAGPIHGMDGGGGHHPNPNS